jgi:hypothetical protein
MRRPARDEAGAYLVLYALLGVVFFTVAAIVLDIAALRQGRRSDRAASDLAATAGVAELDAADPASFARACEDAWGYVLANRTEAGATASAPPCAATFPTTDACTGLSPARTATGTIGPLRIEITHPVPDSSPLMLAEAQGGDIPQAVDVAIDGSPCERLGVRIVRNRTFLFAQIAGAIGGTTDVHSVARALTTTSTTEVPAVVTVATTGCGSLVVDPGAGSLRLGGGAQAGLAIVDTDAAGCAAGSYAVSAGTSGDPADRITALPVGATTGQLRAYALSGTNFASAYDPGAVGDGRLDPQPEPALTRTGRALVDNRYRCSTCAGGSDVITPLEADRGGPGAPASATFTVPSTDCTVPAGPPVVVSATHAYVDCDDLLVDGSLTFLGQSVTLKGNVTISDGGCIAVNDATCGAVGITAQDADVYVRGGVTKATKAVAVLPRTFLYTGGALTVGVDPDTTVGNSTLSWTAPEGGPFEDLLVWTESNAGVLLGEQRNTTLEGTLAAPRAPVTLNPRDGGGGVTAPLQVLASTVRLTGNGTFRLQPSADRATGAFTRQVRLIR